MPRTSKKTEEKPKPNKPEDDDPGKNNKEDENKPQNAEVDIKNLRVVDGPEEFIIITKRRGTNGHFKYIVRNRNKPPSLIVRVYPDDPIAVIDILSNTNVEAMIIDAAVTSIWQVEGVEGFIVTDETKMDKIEDPDNPGRFLPKISLPNYGMLVFGQTWYQQFFRAVPFAGSDYNSEKIEASLKSFKDVLKREFKKEVTTFDELWDGMFWFSRHAPFLMRKQDDIEAIYEEGGTWAELFDSIEVRIGHGFFSINLDNIMSHLKIVNLERTVWYISNDIAKEKEFIDVSDDDY
jgi:hypothetical protein